MARRDPVDRVKRQTKFTFIMVEVVAALITMSAFADKLLSLGWGYDWKTGFIGVGICAFGFVVYAACLAVFRLLGSGL